MKLMTKKTTTEAISKNTEAINKVPGAEVDTTLLEEDTGDLKTPLITPTEVHQLTKAEVHIKAIGAIKFKVAEEDKITTKIMVTQAKTIENTANNQPTQ